MLMSILPRHCSRVSTLNRQLPLDSFRMVGKSCLVPGKKVGGLTAGHLSPITMLILGLQSMQGDWRESWTSFLWNA